MNRPKASHGPAGIYGTTTLQPPTTLLMRIRFAQAALGHLPVGRWLMQRGQAEQVSGRGEGFRRGCGGRRRLGPRRGAGLRLVPFLRPALRTGGVRLRARPPRAGSPRACSTRAVVMMPALGRMLAQHRLASAFSGETDPVFATARGTTMNRDNVRSRILAPAVEGAELNGQGRPRLRTHDLRHTFASLLIAGSASIVFVASQLGHSSPTVTLSTYAHLFDERDHGARMATILEDGFGGTLEAITAKPRLAAVPG